VAQFLISTVVHFLVDNRISTDEALLKMLYLATQDVLRKWTARVQNWGQILLQLSIFFPEKVKAHLR
jgi:putative transposase